jgi:uncharacterized protein (TIGR03435 family)
MDQEEPMTPLGFLTILISAAVAGFAQVPVPLPTFEVASVKAVAPGSSTESNAERDRGFAGAGGKVYLRGVSLSSLLIKAWNLQPDQLTGPAWLSQQAFDISAVAPAGTTREKILEMTRNLLIERFKLKYHRETVVAPFYALVQASGGTRLLDGIPDDEPEKMGQLAGPGTPGTVMARAPFGIYKLTVAEGVNHYQFQNITMEDFNQFLNQAARRALELPVVDMTGMTGRYQVALDIAQSELHGTAGRQFADQPTPADPTPAASDPPGSSIRLSLQKQGLRLERRNAPREKFVVDAIERAPSEN